LKSFAREKPKRGATKIETDQTVKLHSPVFLDALHRSLSAAHQRCKKPDSARYYPQLTRRNHGQGMVTLLELWENLMSPLQRVCRTLGVFVLAAAFPVMVYAQAGSGYVTNGSEYAPAGILPGDQIDPSVSINSSGGLIVWADNITDGSGYGISGLRLDSTYSPLFSSFRINLQGADDQEQPQVALLKSGGAAVVWQGGKRSFQHIYAAFLSASNTFVARDVPVNTATNYQSNPALATLTNGNVVVCWSSRGQDAADGLSGIYARLFTPNGTNVSGEFLVNQFTPGNQRTPAVAGLGGGNFVVVWVSELERNSVTSDGQGNAGGGYNSVDVYARLFNASGVPVGNEFLVNTTTNICANPNVAAASDGTFVIGWSEKDPGNLNNSWDVYTRKFSAAGSGGTVQRMNTQRYGDQWAPKLASVGTDYLVVWTSMGQDGSREGVFGQFLNGGSTLAGGEFRVNTTFLNQQKFPAVGSDGSGRFLVVWSSYSGGVNSLDLNAQRYATYQQPLSAPAAPIVSALASYALSVAWAPLAGFNVDHWELYVDGSGTPIITANTLWQNMGLQDDDFSPAYNPSSTHTFQVAYVLADGRHSPLSAVASGKTWGLDKNNDGLPDDWQAIYWGTNKLNWPGAGARLASDGTTVLMVFEWGANPLDPSTWLRAQLQNSPQGWYLSWNTRPGGIYQVQTTTDLGTWTNLGGPRYAAGATDSLYLGLAQKGYYRLTRLVY
jgi:hypothetical protein